MANNDASDIAYYSWTANKMTLISSNRIQKIILKVPNNDLGINNDTKIHSYNFIVEKKKRKQNSKKNKYPLNFKGRRISKVHPSTENGP